MALSVGPAIGQVAPGRAVPLGLNIDLNEQAYVDVMFPFARIAAVDGPLSQDEAGWPLGNFELVIDNRYTFAWVPDATNIDPLRYSTDISGTYQLSFTGQAVLRADSGATVANQAYDASSNTTTAEINVQNPPGGVLVVLSFLQTQRDPEDPPGNGLTNLHLIRPGYSPGTNQIFTDLWLSSIVNFPWTALRFMGVLGTNSYAIPSSPEVYPYLLQWDTDRALPTAGPMYGRSHLGNHGIPWEYVILIANAANADAWINIPVNASDDYVVKLAALMHDGNAFTGFTGINANLNVYVEYSNELWHYGFPQGAWNYGAAGDEVAAGGSTLNYDGSTNQDVWRQRRIAKRTMEIGQVFAAAFADNPSRIRPVIDDANVFTPENMLQYLSDVYGPPSQLIYGISITGYYSSSDKTSVDAIIQGEKDASDRNLSNYIRNRTIATYWGLHSLVYEGGQDEEGNPRSAGPPLDPNLPNQFAAARDPRMVDVELHDLIDNWYPSGGELYMQFAHAGRYSTYGMWGLSDDLNNQSSGKWNGVIQTMATPAPSITAGTPLPGMISANVRFWRAPPARFEQWLVRSDAGGTYDLVINLDTRFADTQLEVWVNNALIQSLAVPRDSTSSGQTDLSPVSLPLAPGLSVVRLKLLSGDTNLNTLTFTAQAEANTILKQVLAFYYPWYGNPDVTGSWVHWQNVDPEAITIGNATWYPELGAYDSHDPEPNRPR